MDETVKVVLAVGLDDSAAKAGVNDIQNKLNNLNNTVVDKPFKTIKQDLKDATNEAQRLAAQFGTNSDQFTAAAKKVAGLKDQFGEFTATVAAFNPDNKLQALVSVAKGATGAIQGVTSGMALLGIESETAVETIKKLEALQGLSNMLNNVDDLKNGFSNLQGVFKSSFATLKAGIISTGIGLLVIAAGLVYANFEKIKEVVLKMIPGLASVGKFVGELVDKFTDFIGVTNAATRAQEKFSKDTERSIKKAQEFLDANGDKFDKYTQAKIKSSIDLHAKEEEIRKDSTKSEAEKFELIKQYREKHERTISNATKERIAENETARKTELDKETKNHEERLAKTKAANDKQRDEATRAKKELADVKEGIKKDSMSPSELAVYELEQEFDRKRAILIKNNESTLTLEKNFRNDLSQVLANSTALEVQTVKAAKGEQIQANIDVQSKLVGLGEEEVKQQSEWAAAVAAYQAYPMKLKVEAYQKTAGNIAEILGKETAAGKAASVAQATIQTYQSATSAYASMSPIPLVGPALGIVAAAAAVAAGIANVKKILSVKVPGKGGGSGGSVPSAPSAMTAPQVNPTMLLPEQRPGDVRVTNLKDQVLTAVISDRELKNNEEKRKFLNAIGQF